ncbi:hypothetical protein [Niveispirillum fermenti]|uniref:hypothetical protein n=1 Tax=Niveispirillum fermenti TaxID=1233113 RepID=UPI003A889A21
MRMMLEVGLVLVCATLFALMTALAVKAQQNPEPPAPAKAQQQQQMEDEIIVRGRRDGEPGFQESWEHHRQEFDRLHKIYGTPGGPNRRADRMTDTPNPDSGKSVMRSPSSDSVQGRPSRD